MNRLEFGLEVLVNLINLVHLFIELVLIRDHKWHQKLGGISFPL